MSAKKKPTEEQEPVSATELVTVVAETAMFEDRRIEKGESFQTTPERAAALGNLVKPAE